uniref:Uncharacterized protein n=1 Tax=Sinocyclocheilus grahami TaxID=75366 RepID=A0A672KMC3_SINGR
MIFMMPLIHDHNLFKLLLNADNVTQREEYNMKLHKLKRSIKELTSDFEKEQHNLSDKIMEMMKSIEKLEFMHKVTTVGNLAGSSMGVAGGVTAIVGLALSPVTLGVSLLVTGAGAVAIAAGGTTRHACNLTNMMKLESLQETIHTIINDLLSTILPIMQQMRTISNILEEMKEMEQGMRVMQAGVRTARANSGDVHAEEGSRNRRVYAEMVRSFKVCERAEQIFSVAAQADKVTPEVTAVTGIVSALFVVIVVVRIAQSYKEIATMNKKKKENKLKNIINCMFRCAINKT